MNEWVELLVTYDEVEAQIVKNILEAENISVVIDSSKIRPYPVNIGRIGEVKLMVKKEDVEKAREVLKIMRSLSVDLKNGYES
jgi:hypothetical protein